MFSCVHVLERDLHVHTQDVWHRPVCRFYVAVDCKNYFIYFVLQLAFGAGMCMCLRGISMFMFIQVCK